MSFFEIMVNLLIGISGGIFSSIIVSRIFLIVTDYSEQIARVQARVEVTYGLKGALLVAEKIFEDGYMELGEKYKQKLQELVDSELQQYSQMIFDDLEKELHEIAAEYNDFFVDFNVSNLDQNKVKKELERLEKLGNSFNRYKNKHKKKLFRLFFKDIVLKMLFVILLIIIMLTIIA